MDGLVVIAEGGPGLCAPCVDADNLIYCASPATGEVLQCAPPAPGADKMSLNRVAVCGSPNALACHGAGGLMGGDAAGQTVFRIQDGTAIDFISDNRGEKLAGPSGLHIAARTGAIFLSDGGAFGETGLGNPRGSVLSFDPSTQTLHTLASGLAHPTGLATSPEGDVLYVCETSANRVLRFAQRPKGAWHGSVFHQFAGLFGPTCVDVDDAGNIYVGRFDFSDIADESLVTILRPTGEEYATFSVPGAEISGLCIDRQQQLLYVTEASTGTLHRRPLPTIE